MRAFGAAFGTGPFVFLAAALVMVAGLCDAAGAAVIRVELRNYFAWQAVPAHASYFDGRLLTANDLQDDQSYSRSSVRYLGTLPDTLDRVFAPAAGGDWVLFFDEAYALFGKRTGVMDANDKYADDYVLLDLGRGTWHGRLYVAGTADTDEGVYDDLSGTFARLTAVAAPAGLPVALLGLAALALLPRRPHAAGAAGRC